MNLNMSALTGSNLAPNISNPTGTTTVTNGKIQYTPTAGYNGVESLTYTGKDVLNTT